MNRPVAALVIFRSCLQWKTFQADRTVLFDKVPTPRYTAATSCIVFIKAIGCRRLAQHLLVCCKNTINICLLACMKHMDLSVDRLRMAAQYVCVLQIINAMGGQIEKQQDANGCLSYWLSNTVTLLYLLQRNIKPASGGAYNARLRSPGSRYGVPSLPSAESLSPISQEDLRRTPVYLANMMCISAFPKSRSSDSLHGALPHFHVSARNQL